MPRSDREFVDFKAIKQSVSMLQILEHYGLMQKMRRSGDRVSGACPIHKGQNQTAFRVSIEKNCWNCFSDCHCGGNILDFVGKMENVDVLEAALLIKGWFKLSFPEPERDSDARPREKPGPAKANANGSKRKEPAPEAETGENPPLKFALNHLQADHPYLKERGLTEETIATFSLGFCQKGIMAGHVAIPVHNAKGELVAYAGRWPGTPPNPDEKYKLPKGFMKSWEVFNLRRAVEVQSEGPLVIVEGFFDAIKLHQHGWPKVVALMGSFMSPAQEELIRRHTNARSQIFLMLDEDDAGRAARDEIAPRLARFCFVKVHQFAEPDMQPEHLSAEEVRSLLNL